MAEQVDTTEETPGRYEIELSPEAPPEAPVDTPSEEAVAAAMQEVMGEQEAAPGEEVVFDFGGDKMTFAKDATAADIHEQLQQRTNTAWRTITQKNQDLSAQQRQYQEALQRVQQYGQVNDEVVNADMQVRSLHSQLSQYTPEVMDTVRTNHGDDVWRQTLLQRDVLKEQMQQAEASLTAKRATLNRSQQDQYNQQLAAGQAELARIPGFDKEADNLANYVAQNYGSTPEQVKQQLAMNPRLAGDLLDAMRFRTLQRKLSGSKVAASPGNGVAATPPSQRVRGGASSESGVGSQQLDRAASSGNIEDFMNTRWQQQREAGG